MITPLYFAFFFHVVIENNISDDFRNQKKEIVNILFHESEKDPPIHQTTTSHYINGNSAIAKEHCSFVKTRPEEDIIARLKSIIKNPNAGASRLMNVLLDTANVRISDNQPAEAIKLDIDNNTKEELINSYTPNEPMHFLYKAFYASVTCDPKKQKRRLSKDERELLHNISPVTKFLPDKSTDHPPKKLKNPTTINDNFLFEWMEDDGILQRDPNKFPLIIYLGSFNI